MKTHWIASLCLALSATLAHASQPFELEGSVAYASTANKYLLTYSSNELDGGPNIYGRVLKSDGTPSGDDFRLSTQAGEMSKPVVAYSPSSERYLVVWGRKLYDEKRSEIIGLNVGPSGNIIGQEFRVSFSEIFDQRPSIAYCPKGDRFLVTWTRGTTYDFDKGVSDVYGQFVGGDGTSLQGGNFEIAAEDRNQFKSNVTCNAVDDRFLVVWEDQRSKTTQDDIYGQLISSGGALFGGNFFVAGTQDVERRPVAAAGQDGTYLVSWESQGQNGTRLYTQKLDANGRPMGQPALVGPDLAGSRDRPAVAYLQQQNVYLVVFHDSAFGSQSDSIYGQFVEGDGRLRNVPFAMTTANMSQNRPNVAASKNNFLAVWTDFRTTRGGDGDDNVYEYYGRVVGNDMALSARWKNPQSK